MAMIGASSVNIWSVAPVTLPLDKATGLLDNCIVHHRKYWNLAPPVTIDDRKGRASEADYPIKPCNK